MQPWTLGGPHYDGPQEKAQSSRGDMEGAERVFGCQQWGLNRSGGRFGAKHALETRASEMDTNELFTAALRIGDVNDAAVRGEIGLRAARDVVGKRNADFEVRADGNIEARQ